MRIKVKYLSLCLQIDSVHHTEYIIYHLLLDNAHDTVFISVDFLLNSYCGYEPFFTKVYMTN